MNRYIGLSSLSRIINNLNKEMNNFLDSKLDESLGAHSTKKLNTVQFEIVSDDVTTAIRTFDGTQNIVLSSNDLGLYDKFDFDSKLTKLVDRVLNKDLTSNEFTSEFRDKLIFLATGANNYVHDEKHDASVIEQKEDFRLLTDVEISNYNDKYTKEETDVFINDIYKDFVWLPAVETYDDILVKYPNPVDGNVVNVNDTDITYRYTGSEWIAISANIIPMASNLDDGKMDTCCVIKLEGIEANANNYKHEETHNGNIIVEDSEHRFATDEEISRWNSNYTREDLPAMVEVLLESNSVLPVEEIDAMFMDIWDCTFIYPEIIEISTEDIVD